MIWWCQYSMIQARYPVFYALISYTHIYVISGVLPPVDVKQPAIPASLASAALAASHASLRLG